MLAYNDLKMLRFETLPMGLKDKTEAWRKIVDVVNSQLGEGFYVTERTSRDRVNHLPTTITLAPGGKQRQINRNINTDAGL